MAQKRIKKELQELMNNPPNFFTAGPIEQENLFHWSATLL
jgi:ubiquitin-protein ligase